jgi:hypothetical protein
LLTFETAPLFCVHPVLTIAREVNIQGFNSFANVICITTA